MLGGMSCSNVQSVLSWSVVIQPTLCCKCSLREICKNRTWQKNSLGWWHQEIRMQTAGVGCLSLHFITSVSKNVQRLLQINGFYRGYRQLLNKEKVFRERCKSRGFILLHEGGPVTAMIKLKTNYMVMLFCMVTHGQVQLLSCCSCLVPN